MKKEFNLGKHPTCWDCIHNGCFMCDLYTESELQKLEARGFCTHFENREFSIFCLPALDLRPDEFPYPRLCDVCEHGGDLCGAGLAKITGMVGFDPSICEHFSGDMSSAVIVDRDF